MKKIWVTKTGEEIEISKMTETHLINSIKMIERYAKNGLNYVVNLGYAPDNDYVEYDTGTLYGDDVYKHFSPEYQNLKAELKKRQL